MWKTPKKTVNIQHDKNSSEWTLWTCNRTSWYINVLNTSWAMYWEANKWNHVQLCSPWVVSKQEQTKTRSVSIMAAQIVNKGVQSKRNITKTMINTVYNYAIWTEYAVLSCWLPGDNLNVKVGHLSDTAVRSASTERRRSQKEISGAFSTEKVSTGSWLTTVNRQKRKGHTVNITADLNATRSQFSQITIWHKPILATTNQKNIEQKRWVDEMGLQYASAPTESLKTWYNTRIASKHCTWHVCRSHLQVVKNP
jgi:hypothetical protein